MQKLLSGLLILILLSPIMAQVASQSAIDGPVHDGQEVTADLPVADHIRNIGSELDGAGECTMSAIEMAALAQGLEEMRGWRNWCAKHYGGGGWPEKISELLTAYGTKVLAAKGQKVPDYYQYEGRDPDKIYAAIDKTGRPMGSTYGFGPRYVDPRYNPRGEISHMITVVGYGKYAIVLDNNFVATRNKDGVWNEKVYEWMEPSELCRRAKLTGGSAWIFCWLPPAYPPSPKNLGARS